VPPIFLVLAAFAAAEAPESPLEGVRGGLLAAGRLARERAESEARQLARTDPAAVAALWDGLDLQGRCILVRALASAGTERAARMALARAADPNPEVFRALLDGLARGGETSLFAPVPEDLPKARQRMIDELRLRWRVEGELAALKSPTGPTGHYRGQYKRLKQFGSDALPVLFDIVVDRAAPLPGEGAAGPYVSIHPGMAHFERQELRQMAASAFGEVADPDDNVTIARLVVLWERYHGLDGDEYRFEREELARDLAFSLFDLGVGAPVGQLIAELRAQTRQGWGLDSVTAMWDLGYACIRIGRFSEGEHWYRQVLEQSPSKAIAAYNLACNFSMRAMQEPAREERFRKEALEYLELAIRDFNYGDWVWMEEDGDLDFIRDDPKYKELLRYLQAKYPERKKGTVAKDRKAFLGGK